MAGSNKGSKGSGRASGGAKVNKPLRGVGTALKNNLKGFKGLPVVVRSKAQAAAAQRARSNVIGKATAASRGSSEAIARGQRGGFVDSAPRTVVARPRISQLTTSGRVDRVGAGRFRTIGERTANGRVYRPTASPGPIRGSRSYQRELDRRIKANNGKDVAAFRFA
jgi:hypothetical protein